MARTTIRTEDVTDSEVTTAKMATDPTNATNLASGTVADARLGTIPADITANQDDIALLGFKVAANGSLARYNLVDQSIDAFEDASGVDASASSDAVRNASNYYSGLVNPTATGGAISTSGDYTFHYFTASGDFVTDTAQSMDVLLVAGGGGGGRHSGGGGGGGGLIYQTGRSITAATHAYVQGAGGATRVSDQVGIPGDDSTWNGLTAKGGGGGGYYGTDAGTAGGSSGGSSRGLGAPEAETQTGQAGDSGTYGFGNIGGSGDDGSSPYPAAGGGGAGGAGGAGTTSGSGAGGAGKELTIFSSFGVSGFFAGGGGGQTQSAAGEWGAGGSGGGGRGGGDTSGTAAEGAGRSGTANTGGGGGGSSSHSTFGTYGAAGGSGTLIIRRLTVGSTPVDMTLISNAITAESVPTTGDLVITYTNGAGTATINTDIKAYISRDGSAYSSAVTLVDQGDTGGHTILTANGVDLSGITSGTSMRWKIETLNQGVSKDTRIQAVSLGWS